jgi:hypothetical protein
VTIRVSSSSNSASGIKSLTDDTVFQQRYPLGESDDVAVRFVRIRKSECGERPKPTTRTSLGVKRAFVFLLARRQFGLWMRVVKDVALKLRCYREQTAHPQAVLLHLSVRTQIRTAQPGSIRATLVGHD